MNIYDVKIPELVPAGKQGVATVEHFEVSREASAFTAFRAMQHGPDEHVGEGTYARLMIGHTLMMSDTHMERSTNSAFVRNAKGHVLVAGLGLGLILFAIADKPEVTQITVVEKYQDVVDLVGPAVMARLGAKLTIVTADIHDWKPEKGVKFDTLYFDIWAEQSTDDLREMATLHRRFAHSKAPGAWMASWRHDELKARRGRERRNGRRWW
jgi:spermidine synthase